MKKSTRRIILAALEGDETLSTDELRLLRQTLIYHGRPGPPPDPPLLLSQGEAARLMGFSRHTLHRLVRNGAISPVFIGGTPKYRRKDVERLVEEGWSMPPDGNTPGTR